VTGYFYMKPSNSLMGDNFPETGGHRYERKSLLVTSNQPFREWDEIFPSGSMTVAAVDRLVHHCHIVGIKGDSYRQKAAAARASGDAVDPRR
jgi:hypothetical protein